HQECERLVQPAGAIRKAGSGAGVGSRVAGYEFGGGAARHYDHGRGKPMGARGNWRANTGRYAPQEVEWPAGGEYRLWISASGRRRARRTGSARTGRARGDQGTARQAMYSPWNRRGVEQERIVHAARVGLAA